MTNIWRVKVESTENRFYAYVLLDPRKPGKYVYGEYSFDYEPFYVGKGTGCRANVHMQEGQIKNPYNSYKSNKIKNILAAGLQPVITKISKDVSEQIAFNIEIYLISIIKMKHNGGPLTNLNEGGMGSSKSEETKRKISVAKKESYASGKVIHPMLGKHHKPETIEMFKIQRTGKKLTAQQKDKLSLIHREKKPPNTQDWHLISPEGEKFSVYGLGEFCRQHGLNQSHLFNVATGKRKHHKGWKCYRG